MTHRATIAVPTDLIEHTLRCDLHVSNCDDCRKLSDLSAAARSLAGEAERAQDATLGLRKRIHFLERHNQHFERCESGWCNPSEKCNPAIGVHYGYAMEELPDIHPLAVSTPPVASAPYVGGEVLQDVANKIVSATHDIYQEFPNIKQAKESLDCALVGLNEFASLNR